MTMGTGTASSRQHRRRSRIDVGCVLIQTTYSRVLSMHGSNGVAGVSTDEESLGSFFSDPSPLPTVVLSIIPVLSSAYTCLLLSVSVSSTAVSVAFVLVLSWIIEHAYLWLLKQSDSSVSTLRGRSTQGVRRVRGEEEGESYMRFLCVVRRTYRILFRSSA
ncbi:hypothetical protein Hypma_016190 [Hypsizygus marmoreus]|uniref:Uncharacterized protein n=1 Tax=Hypsizygus marmoreus TaxID=39966 RepID=A0A369IYZ6_HYPMA|nr:hypothetical protein Hypma_016190 [Hypsizygus marmoreus]